MRNTINQAVGRLARSPNSRGLVLIHDTSYAPRHFPSWSLENETVRENSETPRNGQTFDKRRIDVISSQAQYNLLIGTYRKTQENV
jgi:Rad3-related DNA helicase